MPKGYTDKTTIENYIMQNIDASFSTQLNSWISAVEKFIDVYTGRNFLAVAEPSEGDPRYYDGKGSSVLLIDDCQSVSSVMIDDEEITLNEWYLYPANDLPKHKIILKGNIFTSGNQNVVITGVWGFSSEIPEDVKLAATVLVAGILANGQDSSVRSETIGRYSVSYADEKGWADFKTAMDILESYRKFSF